MNKNILILLSLLISGCGKDIIVVTQEQPKQIIVTPTSKGVTLCFSKDLQWAQKQAENYCKERFNNYVAVLVNSYANEEKDWMAFPDNGDPVKMDVFALSLCLEYRQSDIVIFSNNPTKAKLGAPRVWYFEKDIFINNTISCSIWKAVSQWGYTLEK